MSQIGQRCQNPKSKAFKYYGARGISVCNRWDFFPYFVQDVGLPPNPRFTLDRIDNNGNYEPGNVRWATRMQQANNTRYNVRISHGTITKNQNDWARTLGICRTSLVYRIKKWGKDKAISATKDNRAKRVITHGGVTKDVKQWADHLGIKVCTLRYRIKRWGVDMAVSKPRNASKDHSAPKLQT